jgi:hypothetical protein
MFDMNQLVWIDGDIVAWEDATVHVGRLASTLPLRAHVCWGEPRDSLPIEKRQ